MVPAGRSATDRRGAALRSRLSTRHVCHQFCFIRPLLCQQTLPQPEEQTAVTWVFLQRLAKDRFRFFGLTGAQQRACQRLPHGVEPCRRLVIVQPRLQLHRPTPLPDRAYFLPRRPGELSVERGRGKRQHVGGAIVEQILCGGGQGAPRRRELFSFCPRVIDLPLPSQSHGTGVVPEGAVELPLRPRRRCRENLLPAMKAQSNHQGVEMAGSICISLKWALLVKNVREE